MKITGMVVRALPGKTDELRQRLNTMDGVCVHTVEDAGQMLVTVKKLRGVCLADQVTKVERADGVLSTSLIHNYFEDIDEPVV